MHLLGDVGRGEVDDDALPENIDVATGVSPDDLSQKPTTLKSGENDARVKFMRSICLSEMLYRTLHAKMSGDDVAASVHGAPR